MQQRTVIALEKRVLLENAKIMQERLNKEAGAKLRMVPTLGGIDDVLADWNEKPLNRTELVQMIDQHVEGDPRVASMAVRLMPKMLVRLRQLERLVDTGILGCAPTT